VVRPLRIELSGGFKGECSNNFFKLFHSDIFSRSAVREIPFNCYTSTQLFGLGKSNNFLQCLCLLLEKESGNCQEPTLRIKGTLLILLTVSLGTALAMTARDEGNASGDVVGAVTKDSRTRDSSDSAEQASSEMHFDLAAIKRPIPKSVRTTGLFDSKSWYAPPPAPVVTAPAYVPPPQPTAPTLPFTFIGRMLDGNEVTVFLSSSDRRYAVKEKDVLDDTYRVDRIGEGEAVLTHLPTNTQQTLSFNTTPAANALISASELKAVMHPDIPPQQPPSN
jgi:hypothetical protein